jgi:hypothetical protein
MLFHLSGERFDRVYSHVYHIYIHGEDDKL